MDGELDVTSKYGPCEELYAFESEPQNADVAAAFAELERAHRQSQTVMQELLGNTVAGAVRLLNEILELTAPEVFARARRIRRIVEQLVERLEIDDRWEYRVAAQLSQIGLTTLPDATVRAIVRGYATGLRFPSSYPAIGESLLKNIPRLEGVAAIVGSHLDSDGDIGDGRVTDGASCTRIGAALLKIATEFDLLRDGSPDLASAARKLRRRLPAISYEVLKALLPRGAAAFLKAEAVEVSIDELEDGMVLRDHLTTVAGHRLLSKGHVITQPVIEKLSYYLTGPGLRPISVSWPSARRALREHSLHPRHDQSSHRAELLESGTD